MTEQEFKQKLREQANTYLNEGQSTEDVQAWVDRQKQRYADKMAQQQDQPPQPTPEDVDPQVSPKATEFKGTKEDQIYEAGESIGLTKDDVIPEWIQGSDFLEGAYFTIAKQFPSAFTGAATAIAAKDMQKDQGELASLRERMANSENPEAETYVHSRQAVGFGSAGPGARPTLQEVPLAQRIEQLENKIRTDKAGIVKNLFEMKELNEEMAVFDNPEIFDEDGMTMDDFQGMVGRQVPQMAMSALTFGMGAFGQEFGSAYADNLDAIAREKYGLAQDQDPTEEQLLAIIEAGEDEAAVALATGAVSGSLEFVGANQAVGALFKSGAVKGVLRGQARKVLKEGGRQALKNGLVEGLTEVSQGITQDVGRGVASGTEIELDPGQMMEEGAQGAVIGSLFGGAGGVRSQRAANAKARAEYRRAQNKDGSETIIDSEKVDNMAPEEVKEANKADAIIVEEQNQEEKANIETEQDIDQIVQESTQQEEQVQEEQQLTPEQQEEQARIQEGQWQDEETGEWKSLPEDQMEEAMSVPQKDKDEMTTDQNGYFVYNQTVTPVPVYNAVQQVRNEAQDRIKDRTAVNQDIILSMPQSGLNKYFSSNNTLEQINEKLADEQTTPAMKEKLEEKKKDIKAEQKAMYDETAKHVTNFTSLLNTVNDVVKLPTIAEGSREIAQQEVTEATTKVDKALDVMSQPETPANATFAREIEKGNIVAEINQQEDGEMVATYARKTPETDAWFAEQKVAPIEMSPEDYGNRVRLGPKQTIAQFSNEAPSWSLPGQEDMVAAGKAKAEATQFIKDQYEASRELDKGYTVGSPYTPSSVATPELTAAEQTSVEARQPVKGLEFIGTRQTEAGSMPMFRDPKTGLEIAGVVNRKEGIYKNYADSIKTNLGYNIAPDKAAKMKIDKAMAQVEVADVAGDIETMVPGTKKAMDDLRNLRATLKAAVAAKGQSREISPQHKAISSKMPQYKAIEGMVKRIPVLQDQIQAEQSAQPTVNAQGETESTVNMEKIAELESDLDATINELAEAVSALPQDINLPDVSGNLRMFEDVNKRNAQRATQIKKTLANTPVTKKNADKIARLKRSLRALGQTASGNNVTAMNRDIANSGLATKVTAKDAQAFAEGQISPTDMAAKLVKYANGLAYKSNTSILNGDMSQEANIATLEALQNFKPKKVVEGDKSTELKNQILSAVKNRVEFRLRDRRNQLRAMPKSKQTQELQGKIAQAENYFLAKEERMPTSEEIANLLNEGFVVIQGKEIKTTKEGKEIGSAKKKKVGKQAKSKDITAEDVQAVRTEVFKTQGLQDANIMPTEDGDVDILDNIESVVGDAFSGKKFSSVIMKPADMQAVSRRAKVVGYPSAVLEFLKGNNIKLSDYAVELANVGFGNSYPAFSKGDMFGKSSKTDLTSDEIYNLADTVFDNIKDLSLPDAYKQFFAPGTAANPLKYFVDKMAYEVELNDIKNIKFNGPTPIQQQEEFVASQWQDVAPNGVSEATQAIGEFLTDAIPGATFNMSNDQFVKDIVNKKIRPNMEREGYSDATPEGRRAWAEMILNKNAGIKIGAYTWVNENTVHADAPLHEATHIWWSALKNVDVNGTLRQAMYQKLKDGAPEIFQKQFDRVQAGYRHFKGEGDPRFQEEVVVGAVGEYGTNLIFEMKNQQAQQSWKDAVVKALRKVLDYLGLNVKGKNLEDITVDDMLKLITSDVLQGKGGKKSQLFQLKNVRKRWDLFLGSYAQLDPVVKQEYQEMKKYDKNAANNFATKTVTGRNVKGVIKQNSEANYQNIGIEAENRAKLLKGISKLLNFKFRYKGGVYNKTMVDSEMKAKLAEGKRFIAQEGPNLSYSELKDYIIALSNELKTSMDNNAQLRAQRAEKYEGISNTALGMMQDMDLSGVQPGVLKDDVQTLGKENTSFKTRLRERGPLGVMADLLSPSSNDDFYGLIWRMLPKKGRKEAKEALRRDLFDPLETANYNYSKYKGGMMESWNGLIGKDGKYAEVGAKLNKKSGLKKGKMELTNSQVVMLFNYMKDPRNHKQLEKGGVKEDLMQQVIDHMGKDSQMEAFANEIPGLFAGAKSQLNATLDYHGIEGVVDYVVPVGSKLGNQKILKALHGDNYGQVEKTIPYTPFFASADETLNLDEKAFKQEDGQSFYSVMSGNLKERTYGGELKLQGNDLETMMNTYMNGPLRTMAYLDFAKNANAFFSAQNLQMGEAALGTTWGRAVRDSLRRTITGTNNSTNQPGEVKAAERWLNRTIGGIMFVNPRSALLQMVSVTNFMGEDFGGYAKAAANPAASMEALKLIWNSDFIKQRGQGQTDVLMNEVFKQRGNNAISKAVDGLLQGGYFLTKGADRLAIALGGAPYLAAELKRNGGNVDLAMAKFIAKANEAQQSTNPERLGQVQTSKTGRYVLAFTNATQQFNRIMAKSLRDIQAGENVGANAMKILNYAGIQMMGFAFLQKSMQSLLMREREEEKEEEKWDQYFASLFDTLASSSGIMGTAVGTLTNIAVKAANNPKDPKLSKKLVDEFLNIIPAVGTKVRLAKKAIDGNMYTQSNGPVDIPDYVTRTAAATQFATGMPAERVVRLLEQMNDFFAGDLDAMQRLARLLGWSRYDIGAPSERAGKKGEFDQDFDQGFDEGSFDSPTFKIKHVEDSDPEVLGRANDDGSIEVNPNLKGAERKRVIAHEKEHSKQMKSGRLSYTDNSLTWEGKKYPRKNGKIKFGGQWKIEGDKSFPWEAEAEAAESPLTDKKKKKKKKEVSHELTVPGYTKHFVKDPNYTKGLGGSEGGQGGLIYQRKSKNPGKSGGTVLTAGGLQNSYGDPTAIAGIGREWDLGKGWTAGVHGGVTYGYGKSYNRARDRNIKNWVAEGYDPDVAAQRIDANQDAKSGGLDSFTRRTNLGPLATAQIGKTFDSGLGIKATINPMYANFGVSYKFGKKKKRK